MYLNKIFILKKLQQANTHLGPRSGFKNSKWSRFSAQRAQSYIFGFRATQPIIDLDKTVISLRRACNVIQLIIRSNGHLLFVNTNAKYNKIIQQTAKYTNQSYINHKWIGGFLTNWNHMRNVQQQFHAATRFSTPKRTLLATSSQAPLGSYGNKVEPVKETHISSGPLTARNQLDRLGGRGSHLEPLGTRSFGSRTDKTDLFHVSATGREPTAKLKAAGAVSINPLTRRASLILVIANAPRYKKMQKCFEGTVSDSGLNRLPKFSHATAGALRRDYSYYGSEAPESGPDCVIILNASQNSTAIYEAHLNQIPIISIVDSNIPNELYNLITYPIPANFDSVQFIFLFCNCILKTILAR